MRTAAFNHRSVVGGAACNANGTWRVVARGGACFRCEGGMAPRRDSPSNLARPVKLPRLVQCASSVHSEASLSGCGRGFDDGTTAVSLRLFCGVSREDLRPGTPRAPYSVRTALSVSLSGSLRRRNAVPAEFRQRQTAGPSRNIAPNTRCNSAVARRLYGRRNMLPPHTPVTGSVPRNLLPQRGHCSCPHQALANGYPNLHSE